MDEDRGHDDGAAGQTDPPSSTLANPFQTPTQPSIPAWMLARNNSVHAPVFGQPSSQTSHRLPVSSTSNFKATTSQSPFTRLQARSVGSDPKVLSPPPRPRPSVDLDKLDDDQALELLLMKNETVARLFQNACITRVEEQKQKLEHAYNQRLLELEEYTRSWRDATKEIWTAVRNGKFGIDQDQQEILHWPGPQETGRGFNPESHMVPREALKEESDSGARGMCVDVKLSELARSESQVKCQEWIHDKRGLDSRFRHLGTDFQKVTKVHMHEQLIFRTTDEHGDPEYRPLRAIHTTLTNFAHKHCMFIELSPENVTILGKAFCYLKDRRDHCFPQAIPTTDLGIGPGNAERFYKYFSAKPAETHISALVISKKQGKGQAALQKHISQIHQLRRNLLIGRPCFDKRGRIYAADFFDVGSDMRTTSLGGKKDIILFEDRTTLNQIAQLLQFSFTVGILKGFQDSRISDPSQGKDQQGTFQRHSMDQHPPRNTANTLGSTFDALTSQPKGVESPPALLFQRTLALSHGLKHLEEGFRRISPPSQAQRDWLAMGGEAGEVCSLSPAMDRDTPVISRHLALRMEADVLPVELSKQEIIDIHSDGSEGSDLIMLDGHPKSVGFGRREKHDLPEVNHEDRLCLAKRPKLLAPEPSIRVGGQLSHNTSDNLALDGSSDAQVGPSTRAREITRKHLGRLRSGLKQLQDTLESEKHHTDVKDLEAKITHQKAQISRFERKLDVQLLKNDEETNTTDREKHQVSPSTITAAESPPSSKRVSVAAFGPLPPPSAFTARELHQLREQLEKIKTHLKDNYGRLEESTVGGQIEKIEKLRNKVWRFENILEAQRQIETQQEGVHYQSHEALPVSFVVPSQAAPSLESSKPLFTESKDSPDTTMTLKRPSGSATVEGKGKLKAEEQMKTNTAKPNEKPIETEDEYMDRMIREMEAEDRRREEEQLRIMVRKQAKKQVKKQTNTDAVKADEKPIETEDEYMERMIREMEEEDRRREVEQAKPKARKQAENEATKATAEAQRLTDAAVNDAKLGEQMERPEVEKEKARDTERLDDIQSLRSADESSAFEASGALKQVSCQVPTEPKALRRVPKEPKATSMATPHLQKSSQKWHTGPHAASVGPQQQTLQSEPWFNARPANSPSWSTTANASDGSVHSDSAVLQADDDFQQPLRAVASSPPPIRHDDPFDTIDWCHIVGIDQPLGPSGSAADPASVSPDRVAEPNISFGDSSFDLHAYPQKVTQSAHSAHGNAGMEEEK